MKTFSKPSIVLFVLLKYIIFFLFLMILRGDYRLFSSGIIDGLTFFLIFMMPLPALIALIFTFPLFYIFQLKKTIFFILSLVGILIAEYFVYTFYASSTNFVNGLYNSLISVVVGIIFFGLLNNILSSKKQKK